MVRLSSIRVLLSVAFNQSWDLHELGVLNAFLYGDLQESSFGANSKVYCFGSVILGRLSMVSNRVHEHGLKNSVVLW